MKEECYLAKINYKDRQIQLVITETGTVYELRPAAKTILARRITDEKLLGKITGMYHRKNTEPNEKMGNYRLVRSVKLL